MPQTNIKLLVEYDGTNFHGWQRQPELRTVQGVLEDAAAQIFQQPVDINGAGRTDAGVHAIGYVANFIVETEIDIERVSLALMSHLPDDVVVHRAEIAPEKFHAQFDATARRYQYQIGTGPTALRRHEVYHVKQALDVARMQQAAAHFVGEHDFTSFTPTLNDKPPVCAITEASVSADGVLVTVAVEGNRFLHNMVRIIVGTLIDVGRGTTDPERIDPILCTKDRRAAGPTAPPHGLAFVLARYPHE